MSRLPWADVSDRNWRDAAGCPVCGSWAAYRVRRKRRPVLTRFGQMSTYRGHGPRTVLTCCGVRWRIGYRGWRESYQSRHFWGIWS